MDGDERQASGSSVDPASFEELVDAHYKGLYRFALSLSGRESEAADLTQQAFTTWAEKGHQLRDAGKARSWLYTTLHRDFLKKRRREVRFPQVVVEDLEAEVPDVAPDLVERIDAAAVLEAFQQVEEPFRGALALFYIEENSYREIAEILEIPIGTVQSRISRGKAQLHRIVSIKVPGRTTRG